MFPKLPEEIERMIWMKYYSRYVLYEIENAEPIWIRPSHHLIVNTSDVGAIQIGYTDLERRYKRNDEPHCDILRMVLGYSLFEPIKCTTCQFDDDFEWCKVEIEDMKFEKHISMWWDFSYYEEFPNEELLHYLH
jgi:hypothetical protein